MLPRLHIASNLLVDPRRTCTGTHGSDFDLFDDAIDHGKDDKFGIQLEPNSRCWKGLVGTKSKGLSRVRPSNDQLANLDQSHGLAAVGRTFNARLGKKGTVGKGPQNLVDFLLKDCHGHLGPLEFDQAERIAALKDAIRIVIIMVIDESLNDLNIGIICLAFDLSKNRARGRLLAVFQRLGGFGGLLGSPSCSLSKKR